MERRHLHIHRILSVVLLWVFAIALTPIAAFHNHHHDEPKCSVHEKTCTHKLHIGNQTEHCLVCEAHFEKNYITAKHQFQVYLVWKPASKSYHTISGSYTELIDLALRGPPAV